MLSQVEAGDMTSSQLDILLSEPGRYSEWQVLSAMPKQFDRMIGHENRDVVLGSTKAWAILASSLRPMIYDPSILRSIAPNAWAVFLPHYQYMTLDAPGNLITWANALSPGVRDVTSSSAGIRPAVRPGLSALPYQPVPVFDGTDDYMRCVTAFNQPVAYSIFVVYRRVASVYGQGIVGSGTGNPSQGFYAFGDGPTSMAYMANEYNYRFTNSPAAPQGQWGFSRFRRESAALLYHSLNGGEESPASENPTSIPTFNTNPLDIGRAWLQYMNGPIAEVWLIAGNGAADSPEIQRVTNMLKVKYNL